MVAYIAFILLGLMLLTSAVVGWKLMALSTQHEPRSVCQGCGRAIDKATGERCPHCQALIDLSATKHARAAELDEPNRFHTERRSTAKSALQAMGRGDRLLYFKGLQQQQPAAPTCHNPLCSGSTVTTTGGKQKFCSRCGAPFANAATKKLQADLNHVRTKRTELRRYLEVVATADPASADRSLESAQQTARALFQNDSD